MKRGALFACVLAWALAACGDDDGTSSDAATATDSATAADSAPAADSATATDAAPAADPCATATPVCPTATAAEGGGLVALDRCAFPLQESPGFATTPALLTALEALAPRVTMATVLGDLNRSATQTTAVPGNPAGVALAFRWNQEDDDSTAWIPQGLTGSADAVATGLVNGRRVLLVSWYYTPPTGSTYEKGVRIAILDVTTPATPTYRLALLVEPTGTPQAPSFRSVNIHAGGIAWYGDLLYVADTGRGFRVFDLSRMLQVATDVDEIGCSATTCRAGLYKYVIPQVGAWRESSACAPLFSFVALDRESTPPALVSGEYCSGTACAGPLAGRIFRWPLDPATGRLAPGTSWPSEVFLMGQRQVQGGAHHAGTFYLSSSAPAAGAGALYRVRTGASATSGWIDAPEDLMVDAANGLLWSQSEGAGARVVMGARLSSYPAP